MPEPYLSGYYNPGTNSAAFPMSYPAPFNQPAAWSTGTSTQPPSYEHAGFGYGGLTGPNQASDSQQYVAADHLFSQSSPYQSTFAPYLNGGIGNWSYFNNQSSFFFPTGNGDLNLSWGAAESLQGSNAAFLQDMYKQPLPHQEQEKIKIEGSANEMTSGFENDDVNSLESVEHALSTLNVTVSSDVDGVVDAPRGSDSPMLNSVSNSASLKSSHMDHVPSAPVTSGSSNAPSKPVSWAAVASQPAKSKPPPRKSHPESASLGPVSVSKPSYSSQTGTTASQEGSKPTPSKQQQQQNGRWAKQGGGAASDTVARDNDSHLDINNLKDDSPLLKKLMAKFNFNPREFNLNLSNCRFFIIKSYSEDDIFRSIKYSSWTSTEHGNRRLNDCYKEAQRGKKGSVYLLFSVNSSGHFCGVAEMMSEVDINVETGIWVQDKWKGRFDVRWIYVKDVPNNSLRHIRLENNENKPVTNSRDTQEVPFEKGKQIVKIIHNYKAQTSIFDDFSHYEKRQEEDAKLRSKKMPDPDL